MEKMGGPDLGNTTRTIMSSPFFDELAVCFSLKRKEKTQCLNADDYASYHK